MTTRPAPRKFGFDTRMVHAGHIPDAATGARVPIYQTTSYVFDNADQAAQLFELKQYGNIYTRISNPTTAVLEERLASLEGATGALVVASGMAAQFIALMTLLSPGDEVVASSHLYGGTVTQFKQTLLKLSIKVTLVDPRNFDAWEQAITPKTRALYGETIGNPRGSILDQERLAALANAHKIPLIIDNTFATPYLCRPIEHGATIVLHSATKFIGGHGNAIAGAILDSGNFDFSRFPSIAAPSPSYHDLRFFDTFGHYGFLMKARAETVRDVGACVSPMNSFLLIQGLETLSLRMDRHVANAQHIARYLEQNDKVAWVAYAGLPSHPDHALAQKYLPKGPGAVFSFGLKGDAGSVRADGKTFIEALQLFSHLANVGDVRSLVIHPASTTHQQLTDEELVACGVGPEMIRLSVGLENVEDLIWDLDQAFHALSHSNSSLTPEQRARFQDVAQINHLLDSARTIAMVGLSSDRQKASYFVAGYLQDEGYRIIPVNPKADMILGEKVYPDLASIPFPVDLIDIFRPPGDVNAIVDQAIARHAQGIDAAAIWMQLRIINLPAAERALAAGLTVIVDKCVKMEHGRYKGGLHFAGMNTEIISARKRSR